MTSTAPYLLTALGAGDANISRLVADALLTAGLGVRAMVHRDDGRTDHLRARGAEVVVGDLTNPVDVANALHGVRRAFFNMAVSSEYLEAATVFAAIASEQGGLEVVVNLSQMTVSEMASTSSTESRQQRLHWLAEHVLNWSGLPVVHVRPTVFLDNPLFTLLPRTSVIEQGVLALPIGQGRTSPVAAADVARVVTTVLQEPSARIGHVYELTGPEVLDINGLAAAYGRALGKPVIGADMGQEQLARQMQTYRVPDHVGQHILTVAELHRADRYDRLTTDVQDVTGRAPESVERFISDRRGLFDRPSTS